MIAAGTVYKVVLVKSDDTDHLYIFSGAAPTGPCDVPVHEPLEQGKGTTVDWLTGVWVVS